MLASRAKMGKRGSFFGQSPKDESPPSTRAKSVHISKAFGRARG
ncbi:MAG: hypothetical protein U5L45_24680 [Saprospiraceae bacterium]|nr:hypothetical protein [Saprospiraceae bacterium]